MIVRAVAPVWPRGGCDRRVAPRLVMHEFRRRILPRFSGRSAPISIAVRVLARTLRVACAAGAAGLAAVIVLSGPARAATHAATHAAPLTLTVVQSSDTAL